MPTKADADKRLPPMNYFDRTDLATTWNQELSNIDISVSVPQLILSVTDDKSEKSSPT